MISQWVFFANASDTSRLWINVITPFPMVITTGKDSALYVCDALPDPEPSRQALGLVMASRRADSIVDVVWIEPRSIPNSVMVCAIDGDMPEMIVLQPISTAAFAIFIR